MHQNSIGNFLTFLIHPSPLPHLNGEGMNTKAFYCDLDGGGFVEAQAVKVVGGELENSAVLRSGRKVIEGGFDSSEKKHG